MLVSDRFARLATGVWLVALGALLLIVPATATRFIQAQTVRV